MTGQVGSSNAQSVRRQDVGFVYQFHHLLPEFTALGKHHPAAAGQWRFALAAAQRTVRRSLLASVGVAESRKTTVQPSFVRRGTAARGFLPCALANDPKRVLLADEPTGNLDPAHLGHRCLRR